MSKNQKNDIESTIREAARLRGVAVTKFSERHYRLSGKIDVDYWPTTKKAWITKSIKGSFKVNSLDDLIAVSMKELWPEGANFKRLKIKTAASLISPNECCLYCGIKINAAANLPAKWSKKIGDILK